MKTLLKLSGIASVIILIAMGCKKSISDEHSMNETIIKEFNAAFVKEWYYGTFIKSDAFLSYNQKEKGKKLPDWKNGRSFTIGEIQIVEFPLQVSKKRIGISNSESKGNARRIVEASIKKIVFIKNKDKSIMIKEMLYVPEYNYLKSKNYDISDLSLNDYSKSFRGTIRSFNWNGKFENGFMYTNNRNYRIKDGVKLNDKVKYTTANRDCGGVLETWFEYECNSDYMGDVFDQNQCQVMDIIDQTYSPFDCGPEIENCNDQHCMCANFGIGCDFTGDPEPEDCSASANAALNELSSNSNTSNETSNISTIEELADIRVKKYEWVILKNIGWHLFSFEKGVHFKTENINRALTWRWQSLEHQSIGRVGIVLGGSVEYSLISAIPTIGQYNAGMDLDFKVTYSVVCKGSPVSAEFVYNSQKIFNIND